MDSGPTSISLRSVYEPLKILFFSNFEAMISAFLYSESIFEWRVIVMDAFPWFGFCYFSSIEFECSRNLYEQAITKLWCHKILRNVQRWESTSRKMHSVIIYLLLITDKVDVHQRAKTKIYHIVSSCNESRLSWEHFQIRLINF